MSTPPILRPLSIGEILDAGFTLYRRHLSRLLGVTFAAYAPVLLLAVVHDLLGLLATFLAQLVAQIGLIWIVAEIVLGRRPREQGVLGVVLRQIVPVLGLWVMVMVMVLLGTIALVVPGILVGLLTFAVVQVAVVEDDVGAALRRSFHLANGSLGRVAVVMLVVALLTTVVTGTTQLGLHGWSFARWMDSGWQPQTLGQLAVSLAVSAVLTPYSTAVQTLLYFDQRVRKDGLDVALLAEAAGP